MTRQLLQPVLIFANIPWNWTADYVRQTALELSKSRKVYCVFWEEMFSLKEIINARMSRKWMIRKSKNLYFVYPIHWIPFRRLVLISKINGVINICLLRLYLWWFGQRKRKILWIFHPKYGNLIRWFPGTTKVYDCLDNFLGERIDHGEGVERTESEKYLFKQANVVAANSHYLLSQCKKYRSDAMLVPQGFDIKNMSREIKGGDDICKTKPVIGYVGGINDRLDILLLIQLAKHNQEWQFVLWGPIQNENTMTGIKKQQLHKLLGLKNVQIGKSERRSILGVINQFDVAMIPYDISSLFNRYCFPMKIFEYYFAGKPVVSTSIDELMSEDHKNYVFIGKKWQDWQKIINKLLVESWSSQNKRGQHQLALANSWERKIAMICDTFEQ